MILVKNLSEISNLHLEKTNYSQNKVASLSHYSYLNIEAQITSLLRMTNNILNNKKDLRKFKKEFFAKNANQKDIWEYVVLVQKGTT